MGKNKDQVTEQLIDGYDPDIYTLADDWPSYTATHSEMYTVGPFESLFTSNTPDMFAVSEYNELKQKYPALRQAWDHYQMVLKMCRAKESENEN